MGRRVNIQYSVEIEKLEDEVRRLLAEADDQMGALSATGIRDGEVLSPKKNEALEAVRLDLTDIDHRLNDIQLLIKGYLSYKANEFNSSYAGEANSDDPENDIDSGKQILEAIEKRLEEADAPGPTAEEAIADFRDTSATS